MKKIAAKQIESGEVTVFVTRAQLNAAAAANQLSAGEVYLITDENRLAMGLTTSTYETYAKASEISTPPFTASSAISAAEKPLKLLSDGNIEEIKLTGRINSFGTGAITTSAASVGIPIIRAVPNSNRAVFYQRRTNILALRVATFDGNTDPTFGTEVTISSGGSIDDIVFIDNSKFIFTYQDSAASFALKACIGTVSDTGITLGTALTLETTNHSGATQCLSVIDSTKVAVAYRDGGGATQLKVRVLSISGTAITAGTAVTTGAGGWAGGICYIDGKLVVGGRTNFYIGTVSGTTITLGGAIPKPAGMTNYQLLADTLNNKVIVCGAEDTQDRPTVCIGTVSGLSISFSSLTTLDTTANLQTSKSSWSYCDDGAAICTVGTTTITKAIAFGCDGASITAIDTDNVPNASTNAQWSGCGYDTLGNRVYVAFTGTSSYLRVVSLTNAKNTSNAVNGTLIGFSEAAAAQNAVVNPKMNGNILNGSGFTVNSNYFLNRDGTIGLTDNGLGKVGKAISSTKILLSL